MSYFDEPLVQEFMVQNDRKASGDVGGRCRRKRRKKGKGPYTWGKLFLENSLSQKKKKKKKKKSEKSKIKSLLS